MAVTIGLADALRLPNVQPPQIGGVASTPSQVDNMSLFPTSPADFVSRVDGFFSSARVTLTTTVQVFQTVQTVQTFQTTLEPLTVTQPLTLFVTQPLTLFVTQPLTLFVTQTATVQETLRETIQLPAAPTPVQPPPIIQPPQPLVPPVQPQLPDQLAQPAASQVRPDAPAASQDRPDPPTAGTSPGMEAADPVAEPATMPGIPGIPPAQANTGGPSQVPPVKDPAAAQFFGGVPTKTLDLPITVVFLVLFALGGFLHISIYKRNAKRGHKFLLSDLMFDFCMIRVVTCIFRITWSIVSTRGVILVALITLNGGAVVIMAINIFFAQRIVRSMLPMVGWNPVFSKGTLFLVLTVPAIIVLNVIALSISFFSVGNDSRLTMVETALKVGSSWIVWLSVVPLIMLAATSGIPGPPPESFGIGQLRQKTVLVIVASLLVATGAVIRLYTLSNPLRPGLSNPMFTKPVFYTTGFMLEIIVVYAYAVARVDLLFHVPNGSSGPGDYSRKETTEKKKAYTPEEIESLIDNIGVPHRIIAGSELGEYYDSSGEVHAIFFGTAPPTDEEMDVAYVPPRPERVTRRQTVIDAFQPGLNRMSRYVERR